MSPLPRRKRYRHFETDKALVGIGIGVSAFVTGTGAAAISLIWGLSTVLSSKEPVGENVGALFGDGFSAAWHHPAAWIVAGVFGLFTLVYYLIDADLGVGAVVDKKSYDILNSVDTLLSKMRNYCSSPDLKDDMTAHMLLAECITQRNAIVETASEVYKSKLTAEQATEHHALIGDAFEAIKIAHGVVQDLHDEACAAREASIVQDLPSQENLQYQTSRLREVTSEATLALERRSAALRELKE